MNNLSKVDLSLFLHTLADLTCGALPRAQPKHHPFDTKPGNVLVFENQSVP